MDFAQRLKDKRINALVECFVAAAIESQGDPKAYDTKQMLKDARAQGYNSVEIAMALDTINKLMDEAERMEVNNG